MNTDQPSPGNRPDRVEQARALFPFISSGMIFMNHASVAPQCTRIVEVLHRYLNDRSAGRVETYHRDLAVIVECKRRISRLINAESEDRIALTMNTSDALNIVAGGMRWRQGDRILINDLEFPANVYPFMNLRRQGVEIDTIRGRDGRVTAEQIVAGIVPRTRLIAVSAVQFLSGYRIDLEALGTECRRRGIYFVVDGIQAAGVLKIDVQKCRIDAFASGGQKWLLGPQGIGMLYVTHSFQEVLHQASVGWLGVDNPWDFFNIDQPLAPTARRYEGGTLNIPGIYALNEALGVLLEFGAEFIEGRILDLSDRLTGMITEATGLRLHSPRNRHERAGIVTVDLPVSLNEEALQKYLHERQLVISIRSGKLRYSPHFYNTSEEIDNAVDLTVGAVGGGVSDVPGGKTAGV